MKNVLVASKSGNAFTIIESCFNSGFKVDTTNIKENCIDLFRVKRYDFLFVDIDFLRSADSDNEYKKQLQQYWRIFPDSEIIVLTSPYTIRDAVNAVKAGASNYLTYPLNPEEVKYIIDSVQEDTRLHSELSYLRNQSWRSDSMAILRTNSPLMREVFAKVRAVAQTESTVLLTGETGTGKGIMAKLIHQHSKRSENQFISVHCGAIPDTLLESELFGHEKGAFTGAIRRKLGKFEIAYGGTIFLDEIGTISSQMQIKLLQVLQEKIFQRVGGETNVKADERIIAATNVNLKKLCDQGMFRSDLYYRLNVFPIDIPPLRYRLEDLPLLVEFFLKRLNKFYGKNILDIHPNIIEAFQTYDWPGNIRELENLLERAYILETSSILTLNGFPPDIFQEVQKKQLPLDTSKTLDEIRRQVVEQVEYEYLCQQLMKNQGRISNTAQAAGIGVRQLHKLLSKYSIQKELFKSPHKNQAF